MLDENSAKWQFSAENYVLAHYLLGEIKSASLEFFFFFEKLLCKKLNWKHETVALKLFRSEIGGEAT
jgi:hypothetical protein